MIDHCISALRQKRRNDAWKSYIADSLFYSAQDRRLVTRFDDLFKRKEERSGDEIAADIIERCGLVVTE